MRERQKLRRHTLWLYDGDFERLGELYEDLGASVVIRTLVRKHLERIDKSRNDPLPDIDVEI